MSTRPALPTQQQHGRGLWLTFLSPHGAEAALAALTTLSERGLGWVGLDLQHGELEIADVPGLLRVARAAGVPGFVRVGDDSDSTLQRAADTGADGIIVPAIESAAQARAVVAALNPPPLGHRSMGASRSSFLPCPDGLQILAMVETTDGLDGCEEIAAVEGLAGVFVGPYDLALSIGAQSVDDNAAVAAISRVRQAADAAGTGFGLYAGNRRLLVEFGDARWLAVDSDLGLVQRGAAAAFGVA